MLDSFIFSLNTTLPVFLLILFGMFLRKIGIFSESYVSMTDKYVFKIALPILLFKDISGMRLRRDFDWRFVLFCAVGTLVMFLGVWGISLIFIKDRKAAGSFAQGSARGSAAVLGVALAENIYGSSGLAPLMIFAAVPLFNIMSVVILSFSRDRSDGGTNVRAVLKDIATNPMIIGVVAGLPFSFFDVTLPGVITKAVGSVSATATPLALLAIGAAFDFKASKSKLGLSFAASFIKLFVLPAVFIPAAVLLGFRDSSLISVFIMVGAPTTVASYIMAKNMKSDHVLSSNIVMISTLVSSISITFWVFMMKFAGLI